LSVIIQEKNPVMKMILPSPKYLVLSLFEKAKPMQSNCKLSVVKTKETK